MHVYICVAIRVYFNGPTFLMFVNPDLLLYNKNPITDNRSETGPGAPVAKLHFASRLKSLHYCFCPHPQ